MCASTLFCATDKSLEVQIVASTIYLEAGGESLVGKQAVASVIYNRSIERNISPARVCLQRNQFSCWRNGYYDVRFRLKNIIEQKAFLECFNLAQQLCLGGEFTPSISANHYYRKQTKERPYWAASLKNKIIIGNHIFGECKK